MNTFKMKTIITVIGALWLIIIPSFGQGTDARNFDNYFHVGFFQFFTGTFYLGYERMLNEKSSLFLSGGVTLVEQSDEERIGGQANIEYRFFALKGGDSDFFINFDGVYFGPYAKYKFLNVTEIDEFASPSREEFRFETIGGGVLVGLKLTITERIFFDFNLGGGIQYEFAEEENNNSYWSGDIFSPGYTGVLPAANFTFGLKF